VTSVIWSPQSLRDVESIRTFISQDSATYAELGCAGSWRRSSAFTHFLSLAASCRNATFQRFVKFIVAPYRVVYRLREGTVEIATVFRGSREFPEFLR